jgi:hypothetical protein
VSPSFSRLRLGLNLLKFTFFRQFSKTNFKLEKKLFSALLKLSLWARSEGDTTSCRLRLGLNLLKFTFFRQFGETNSELEEELLLFFSKLF